MNAVPRQKYLFGGIGRTIGKVLGKAGDVAKKVVKSPIGKAALLGLGGAGLMGYGPMSGLSGIGARVGGSGIGQFFKGMGPRLFGSAAGASAGPMSYLQKGVQQLTPGILGKLGLTKGGGSMMPTALGGITAASLVTYFLQKGKTEEEAIQLAQDVKRGKGLGLDLIKADVSKYRTGDLSASQMFDKGYHFLTPRDYIGAKGGRVGLQTGGMPPIAPASMPWMPTMWGDPGSYNRAVWNLASDVNPYDVESTADLESYLASAPRYTDEIMKANPGYASSWRGQPIDPREYYLKELALQKQTHLPSAYANYSPDMYRDMVKDLETRYNEAAYSHAAEMGGGTQPTYTVPLTGTSAPKYDQATIDALMQKQMIANQMSAVGQSAPTTSGGLGSMIKQATPTATAPTGGVSMGNTLAQNIAANQAQAAANQPILQQGRARIKPAAGGRVKYGQGSGELVKQMYISDEAGALPKSEGGVLPEDVGKLSVDDFDDIEDYRRYIKYLKKSKKASGGRIGKFGGGMGVTMPSIPTGMPRVNTGGIRELDYRQSGGFVPVGVKEKADDVPAMLSKNEFVMTADAVKAAGGGSVEKGAQRMYDTMKRLEGKVA